MSNRLARAIHPGAVLAYADPQRALALLSPGWLDPAHYVRAVRRRGRRVLEYGCGTGRLTLALARAGVTVTGIDRSQLMLEHLRARLAEEPPAVRARVQLVHGDLRELELGKRFPVALIGDGTFQHLYDRDDVHAFLTRAREHLTRSGHLLLDVALPDLAALGRPEPGAEYQTLRQISLRPLGGDPDAVLAERQFFPAELRGLLERSGAHVDSLRRVSVPARAPHATPTQRIVVECSWERDAGGRGRGRALRPRG